MRTKSLLVAAALVAAGVLSSEAQSNVYSLNVVGYINLDIKPGYNLITSQLRNTAAPTAPINAVLTNAPALADGSLFFGWNAVAQDFNQPSVWVQSLATWYDSGGVAPSTDTAPLGKAYFIKNEGAATTMTLVGEVAQGTTAVSMTVNATVLANNYVYLGDPAPVSQEIATNLFPIANGSQLQTFNPLIPPLGDYNQPLIGDSGSWYDSGGNPTIFVPKVGEGFLYNTPAGPTTWNRSFTVQ